MTGFVADWEKLFYILTHPRRLSSHFGPKIGPLRSRIYFLKNLQLNSHLLRFESWLLWYHIKVPVITSILQSCSKGWGKLLCILTWGETGWGGCNFRFIWFGHWAVGLMTFRRPQGRRLKEQTFILPPVEIANISPDACKRLQKSK